MATPDPLQASLASLLSRAQLPIEQFTLDNGLKVYLQQDPSSPLACVQLWYHIGSSHEPAGHTNLSHVLEHMLFEGSRKLAPGQYSRIIDRLGGTSNASTRDDATVYEAILPSSQLEAALEIMADTMANASLDQAALVKAVEAVKNERRLKVDNNALMQAFERHKWLAHGGNAYAAPSYGEAHDLESLKLETVRTWYRTWYHPNNATLVVVGDVDRRLLEEWVQRHFQGWPAAPLASSSAPRQPAQLNERQEVLSLPGLRDGFLMSFNVPSRNSAASEKTVPALTLALQMLCKGPGSLLYGTLVRDAQILSGIDGQYDHHLRGDTLLSLYAYSNAANVTPEQASERVWNSIEAFKQSPPALEALEQLKLQLLTRQLAKHSAFADKAETIATRAISGISPTQLDQELQTLIALTPQEVQQVAQAFLTRERLSTTHMLAPRTQPITPLTPLRCTDLAPTARAADLSALTAMARIDIDRIDSPRRQIRIWRTRQGGKACFVPTEGSSLFDLQLRFNAGAGADGDTPGVAALTLYMLDQGTGALDAQQFAEQLGGLGASMTRSISHDHATVTVSGLSTAALRSKTLALLIEMIARPAFNPTALGAMKARLVAYLQRREASPAARVDREILSRLFAGHPYATEVAGTSEGIAKLDRGMLQAFHQRAYTAANVEITLVGDLNRTEAETLIDAISHALAQGAAMAPLPVATPLHEAKVLAIKELASNTSVKLALPLSLSPGNADYPATMVANQILGRGAESRLATELRERRSLTYSIYSDLRMYKAGSFLYITWDVQPAYLQASVELVRLIVRCFIEHGPSQAELELAVAQLKGELLRTFADDTQLSEKIAELNTHGLSATHYEDYLARLSQLTSEEVRSVAARLIDLDHIVCVSVGPATEQENLPPLPAADQ